MEILTEFDELQAALAKVNMDESVLPYVNGRLVDDEAFNKSQKILNCPEMISAHKYIYELDMDQLTEEDTDKINQLYDLGVKRGFIIDDLTKWDDDGNEEEETVAVEEHVADIFHIRCVKYGKIQVRQAAAVIEHTGHIRHF